MKRLLTSGSILLATLAAVNAGGGSTPRREDVPKYMEMLKSAKADERAKAAEMLGRRGAINVKDVADAVKPLQNALKSDTEVKVKRAAAKALGEISPEPASDTVPLLADALDSQDHGLRMAAVQALHQYGPEAKDALPALRKLQKSSDKKDAKTIAAAIMVISEKKKKKG